ncbi:MAG: hypothetical protein IJ883_05950 [Eubacterium sp.]|nr:hypothetical protein [Eubacterium sp.]
MDKAKRILALVTVGILVLCIVLTVVFVILYNVTNSKFYETAWMASAFCMLMLPIVIWVMFWIYRLLRGRGVEKEAVQAEEKTEE